MRNRSNLRSSLIFICLGALALGSGSGAALAAGHAGGGGFHGGAGHSAGGGGFHDGGRVFHDRFGRRGFGGFGLGLYFATLPFYYSTFWWGGIPYYYADNTYYQYDDTEGQYETVAPPPEVQKQAAAEVSGGTDVIAYPKSGQSADQQANDKYECHSWAVTQSGFDPTQRSTASARERDDYMRAQAACLVGRGYSVE